MLNNILIILLSIFFVYIAIFTFYFALIVVASTIKPRKKTDNELQNVHKNLIVVIYSHNNEKTIVNLLERLNKQNYPKANYQVHIILDNCTDDSSNKLEFVGGAKLWRLSDEVPLGKDKAVSWLLENLMSVKKADGYVFLNADRIIKNDFLSSVNEALKYDPVIVGSTEVYLEDANYYEKVWSNVNDYNSNIMKLGRSRLNLAVPIDSDILVMDNEVLESVRCIDFKDANSELKYSFLLTNVNYPPKFVPEVKTFVSSIDYDIKRPDFSFKMQLFFKCLNFKSCTNFKFVEFLFSLFKPNPIILLVILAVVATYSFNYYFLFDFPWSVFLAIVLALSFALSVYKSELYVEPLIYLVACPFYTLSDTICKMTLLKKFIKFKTKNNKNEVEKIVVPVTVTNGRNDFPCKLELISEDGFKKAIFKYKNKKQETDQSYVRMCDAVKNISDILIQHGFRLKICQSCAYFSPKIDGTNNMVKGFCNKKAVEDQSCVDIQETLLWGSCEYFIPEEVNKVIDISSYIRNR